MLVKLRITIALITCYLELMTASDSGSIQVAGCCWERLPPVQLRKSKRYFYVEGTYAGYSHTDV